MRKHELSKQRWRSSPHGLTGCARQSLVNLKWFQLMVAVRVFTGQRHTNSDEFVLSAVRKVEEILLFGSDAAKGELKESLEGDWFGGIVEVLETCINKLTDRQMMKVRENFQK